MSKRVARHDLAGVIVPAFAEDCPFCGEDVNLAGECSAKCEASARAEKKKRADAARLQERQG